VRLLPNWQQQHPRRPASALQHHNWMGRTRKGSKHNERNVLRQREVHTAQKHMHNTAKPSKASRQRLVVNLSWSRVCDGYNSTGGEWH
jgi:hypothetical protein